MSSSLAALQEHKELLTRSLERVRGDVIKSIESVEGKLKTSEC
jgi:hypothetical protein